MDELHDARVELSGLRGTAARVDVEIILMVQWTKFIMGEIQIILVEVLGIQQVLCGMTVIHVPSPNDGKLGLFFNQGRINISNERLHLRAELNDLITHTHTGQTCPLLL